MPHLITDHGELHHAKIQPQKLNPNTRRHVETTCLQVDFTPSNAATHRRQLGNYRTHIMPSKQSKKQWAGLSNPQVLILKFVK
jgi:hypothetical protein